MALNPDEDEVIKMEKTILRESEVKVTGMEKTLWRMRK